MRFGQLREDGEDITKPIVRSGFQGHYIRDRSNNEMNILYYSPAKRALRYLLTYSLSIIIVCLSVATSLAILLWKKSLSATDVNMNYVVTLVNTIQIVVF